MKKTLLLLAFLLCCIGHGVAATKIQLSTTLPSEGTPEHLYTMENLRLVYANGATSPTRNYGTQALFAFYAAEVEEAYYIYCYTSNKWIGYTKAAGYESGKDFTVLSDTKIEGAYFRFNSYKDTYYEYYYDISPYTTDGQTDKYLSWNDNVLPETDQEGTGTFGLSQNSGADDRGCRWAFYEMMFSGGIKYALDPTKQTAAVGINNDIVGSVNIPETIYNQEGTPYAVTAIGEYAFAYSPGLTSISMPNSITSILTEAFLGTQLTSIEIPNSVTSIWYNAFYGTALTSLEIPNSVTSFALWAISACEDLETVVVAEGNPRFDSRDNCNAIINTAENQLIAGCKTTIIPNTVTSLKEYAFSVCIGLTSIVIPESVTSIGKKCFAFCSDLRSVKMMSPTPPTAGNLPFDECTNLTTIYVPKGAKEAYNVEPWNSYEIVEFEDTGIAAAPTVDTPKATAPVYDLNGRRASDTALPGVYIKNGKKVLVK